MNYEHTKTVKYNQILKDKSYTDKIEILSEKYVYLKKIIGQGTSASVYLDYNIEQKLPIAVKKVKINFFNTKQTVQLIRQISLLKQLHHPNIICLKDVLQKIKQQKLIYMVFEYYPMNLRQLLNSQSHLSKIQIKSIMFQIICGLAYCHSWKVIHRDLKPQNVLISQNLLKVKLCDFGLARFLQHSSWNLSKLQSQSQQNNQLDLTTYVVTRWYRAPQVILLIPNYTHKIDIWSAGCIFAQLINMLPDNSPNFQRCALFPGSGCYPLLPPKIKTVQYSKINGFPHSSNDQLARILQILGTPQNTNFLQQASEKSQQYFNSFPKKTKIPLSKLFETIDDEAVDLLEKLLRINPNQRISAPQALRHNYFSQIRDQFLQNTSLVEQVNCKSIKIEQNISNMDQFLQFFNNSLKIVASNKMNSNLYSKRQVLYMIFEIIIQSESLFISVLYIAYQIILTNIYNKVDL